MKLEKINKKFRERKKNYLNIILDFKYKFMKKILFIFFLISSFSPLHADWFSVIGSTNGIFRSIFFVNSQTGWAGSYSSMLYKTTNSGINWTMSSPFGSNYYSLYFLNAQTGWVACDGGQIRMTTNGGANWILQDTGYFNILRCVFFSDSLKGWAVGQTIFHTENGGTNWITQISGTSSELESVYFVNSQTGWIAGNNGTILKTTNSGLNWVMQNSGTTNLLSSVHFANLQTGWAAGGITGNGGVILKTINGGTNWNPQISNDTNPLCSIDIVDSLHAYIVGYRGTLRYTSNGGVNWISQTRVDTNNLYSVYFVNSQLGFASGFHTILKTTNGGVTFINNSFLMNSSVFDLSQNYPNPFNPSTKIKFRISGGFPIVAFGNDMVVLKVYDILGKEIATLVNEKLQPGEYEVPFSINQFSGYQLPSGIYFYTLTAGDFRETKKMLLIK